MRKHRSYCHHKPLKGNERIASISLAVCCLAPVIIVITWLGIWLDRHITHISLFMVLAALPVIGLMIAVLMFCGASMWLFVGKRWVSRKTAGAFCVVPGAGWFSLISYWIYKKAYGEKVGSFTKGKLDQDQVNEGEPSTKA